MSRSHHPMRNLERNLAIYVQHEMFGHSIRELSDTYNISYNRVRQIIDNVHYRITHGDDEYVARYDKLFS